MSGFQRNSFNRVTIASVHPNRKEKGQFRGSATILRNSFNSESEPQPKYSFDSHSNKKRSNSLFISRPSLSNESPPLLLAPQVYPHQYTEDPTVAWEMLKSKRPVKLVRPMKLDSAVKMDHVRFVCIACSHGTYIDPKTVPGGDVLIVAGDFTSCGLPKEIKSFNENLAQFKHTYKIVIAGNHECTFDQNFMKGSSHKEATMAKELALKQALQAALTSQKITNPKSLLTNCIYLEDSEVELFGLKIYGTPWQPRFDNWAFNLKRGQHLLDKWNQIPIGVDVLITHTPPVGHGDLLANGARTGCVELLNSVCKRIRPKYHVFGHTHEGYGCTTDGYTKFINCCLSDHHLKLVNNPVIFDIHLPTESKNFFIQQTKRAQKKSSRVLSFTKKK